jgi:hypothetical protein
VRTCLIPEDALANELASSEASPNALPHTASTYSLRHDHQRRSVYSNWIRFGIVHTASSIKSCELDSRIPAISSQRQPVWLWRRDALIAKEQAEYTATTGLAATLVSLCEQLLIFFLRPCYLDCRVPIAHNIW